MPDTVSKTDNFLMAIEKYAEEQRNKLRSEAEEFKAKELNAAEEEGLKEAYVLIQRKMADINNKIASDRSKAESASKKRIFIRRQEIENEVFAKAEKKLMEYTESDKYLSSLSKSAENISKVLMADDVVLYIREKDMKYKDKIQAAFGRACEVKASGEIKIGGINGLSRSMGLIADETLDTRLSMQHEWFCENSGLRISE